jgi:DNA-binding CsgD family transcriptional regulator
MSEPLSAEKARRVIELDEEGLTRVAIAMRLGIHRNTVHRHLVRAGRPLMQRGARPKLTPESVRELRRAGRHRGPAELARLFQVSQKTIRRVLKRRTWRRA